MEDPSPRKDDGNVHYQTDIISKLGHKVHNGGISRPPTDSLMNEFTTTEPKTIIQSTRAAQNTREVTMIDNKENLLLDGKGSFIGDSCVIPNAQMLLQAMDHGSYHKKHENGASSASICPPLMTYANSLAFSDASIPFPSLSSSKSFGPNGMLNCNDTVPTMTQFRRFPSKEFRSFLYQHSTPSTNIDVQDSNFFDQLVKEVVRNALRGDDPNDDFHNNSMETVGTISDLNIAASALLDLSPSMPYENDQYNHAPPEVKKSNNLVINEVVVSSSHHTTSSNIRPNKVPMMRQQNVVDSNNETLCRHHVKPTTRALVERRAQELLTDVPYTLLACKCKNSRCLKLYCSCFQTGTFCDSLVCQCHKCKNTLKRSKPRGSRTRAIYEILSRRLDAFEQRERKQNGNGCFCKKSKCLQKYCVCFANGEPCCPGKCSCSGCENKDTSTHFSDYNLQQRPNFQNSVTQLSGAPSNLE